MAETDGSRETSECHIKNISAVARELRRQIYERRGKGEGGEAGWGVGGGVNDKKGEREAQEYRYYGTETVDTQVGG